MATVVLFHHVLGLTDGVRAFAKLLVTERHTVHTPDLYQGAIAASLEEGFAIKAGIGGDAIAGLVADTLAELPAQVVFAGMSLGVMTAQVTAKFVLVEPNYAALEHLAVMLEAGSLRVIVGETRPLERVGELHEIGKAGSPMGKLAAVVS